MENIALIESFSEFKSNKSIDRVTLMSILEEVFRAALKRRFGSDENFDIIINPDKGDFGAFHHKHSDDISIIDKTTLKVVGDVVLETIYRE